MRQLLFLISFLSFSCFSAHGQCDVFASASKYDVLCGDTVLLSALGEDRVAAFRNNFNCGSVQCPPGDPANPNDNFGTWSNSSTAQFDNPCAPNHPSGTPHIWFNNASASPRQLSTADLDLTTGGEIVFDMRFADPDLNDNASPCENPDSPDEGVNVQYSLDGGATWVNIANYTPNGGNDPVRTVWTTYPLPIPPAAQTNSTRIRWVQLSNTGTLGDYLDHWGLDNVEVLVNPPTAKYTWQHTGNTQGSGSTEPVVPTENTTYTINYEFGNCTSTSSVTINVKKLNVSASVTPNTPVCPGDSVQLDVTAEEILPPSECGLSKTGCVGNVADIPFGTGKIDNNDYQMFGTPYVPAGPISVKSCSNGAGNYAVAGRTQFIVLASEVPAFFEGGQLRNLQLDLIGNSTVHNLTIQIGCTDKTEFTSSNQTEFQTGLSTVFGPSTEAFVAGFNTVEFDVPYDWDGKSNLVFQVCYYSDNDAAGNVFKTASGFNSTIYTESCTNNNNCNTYIASTAVLSQNRPSITLGICYRLKPNIIYSWKPSENVGNPTKKDPRAAANINTTYEVTFQNTNVSPECAVTATVTDPPKRLYR